MYDDLLARLAQWEALGTDTMPSGTRSIGRLWHYGADVYAYLHTVCSPLDKAELAMLEQRYMLTLPPSLRSFYSTMNGLSLFNVVDLNGLERRVDRHQGRPAHSLDWQNRIERPDDALPKHFALGLCYEPDSVIYLDLETERVYQGRSRTSVEPVKEWENLAAMLLSEYDRLEPLYDEQGREIRTYAGPLTPEGLRHRGRFEALDDGAVVCYLRHRVGDEVCFSDEPDLVLGHIDEDGKMVWDDEMYGRDMPLRNEVNRQVKSHFGGKYHSRESGIPPLPLIKYVYGNDWQKEYTIFKNRSLPVPKDPSLQRIMEGSPSISEDDGTVGVYLIDDLENHISGPDIIVGRIDTEGIFYPNAEKYRVLESWIREDLLQAIEESEEGAFNLWAPREWEMRFAYGPTWQDIWDWDDNFYIWIRKC